MIRYNYIILQKKIIINQAIGIENSTKAISKILTALLSKDIQLQYSACGRETCGQKKKSFCDTRIFHCIRGIPPLFSVIKCIVYVQVCVIM